MGVNTMFESLSTAEKGWRRRDFASLAGRLSRAVLLGGSLACVAPFSEMQSARLAGRGVVEIAPSYSRVDGTDDGEVIKIQDNFGVAIATGITIILKGCPGKRESDNQQPAPWAAEAMPAINASVRNLCKARSHSMKR